MSLTPRQKYRLWLIIAFLVLSYAASKYEPASTSNSVNHTVSFQQLFEQQQSNVQLEVNATVVKLLADDNNVRRHQRFIIQLDSSHTLLVAHNIDLAPRIDDLKVGDQVSVFGEYEWNEKGGVLHWTHHDPAKKHITGWIRHQGNQYQ
ncbi:MAG: DUF3465 domain-containing protein [Gammaproteobacteria bacterium]|nr:DUF3465 domain-containing protein [Gammaproteobacteria bacterium]